MNSHAKARPQWRPAATALAAASLALPLAAQAAITFQITDLSAYGPAGLTSIAIGINNDGHIVGNLFDASGNQSGAWYLAAGSTSWSNLAGITGGVGMPVPSRVVGINNSNTILGISVPGVFDGQPTTLTWSAPAGGPGAPHALPGLLSGLQPLALNDSGQYLVNDGTPGNTYVFNGSTLKSTWSLGYTGGDIQTVALNNAGVMAGSVLIGDTSVPNRPRHAFAGLAFGDPVDLSPGWSGTGPNPNASEATALNNVGQVVGLSYAGSYGGPSTPFLWSASAGMKDLDSMVNTSGTAYVGLGRVTSINDSGRIVGQDRAGRAILLTPTGTMNFVAPPTSFGGPATWDTPFGLLPSRVLDFVVAPAGSGYVFINDIGLDDTPVHSLTLGTVGAPSPFGPTYSITLSRPVSETTITIGQNATVSVAYGGKVTAAQGVVNHGNLFVSSANFSGSVNNPDGNVSVFGATTVVDGNLVNGKPVGGAGAPGGPVAMLAIGGNVIVNGTVRNTGNFTLGTGATLSVNVPPAPGAVALLQDSGSLTVDGQLDTYGGSVTLNGGSLNGSGTINTGVTLSDGSVATGRFVVGGGPGFAYFQPGHSPGHFSVVGNLVIGANGVLELQVERQADGSLAWDTVSASQISFLDGSTVQLLIGDGVASSSLQTLTFLNCGSGCEFASSVSFQVSGLPGASVQFGSGGVQVTLPPVQAVPEPTTALLWLAGLLAVAFVARRRDVA